LFPRVKHSKQNKQEILLSSLIPLRHSSSFAVPPISLYLHGLRACILNNLTAPEKLYCKYAFDTEGESGVPLLKVVCFRNETDPQGGRHDKKVRKKIKLFL
jgi:hypothetical protein